MKQFFIAYDPRKQVLTFVKSDFPVEAAKVRDIIAGDEKVSRLKLQVWPMAGSRFNYIKSVLMEDSLGTIRI